MCASKARNKVAVPDRRPLFYYITDRRQLAGISLIGCIHRALDWGVDFIQIREKDLQERALYELVCRAVSLARGTKCRILVNGRADVALAAGADGVHMPSVGLQATDIRSWVPKDFCIGVSVHSMREIRRACEQSADYLLLGHVFPTPSKSGLGPPLGIDFLRKVCSTIALPVFALGGIRPQSIDSVLEAGAAGVAGISLFQKANYFRILNSEF